ncbi:MAG: TIGR04086 family membrane protein [Clostridia bacterium]|nr:TIGR04086 family membrane protein [Clostridia bacterium]
MKSKIPNKKAHSSSSRATASAGVMRASLFGVATGTVSAIILLLICSLICMLSSDPNKLISPLSVVCNILIYFIVGFAASKKKAAAIPCGALSGGLMCIIFFLIALLLSDSISSNLSFPVELLIRLSFIVVSILGALLGVNSIPKRRKKK